MTLAITYPQHSSDQQLRTDQTSCSWHDDGWPSFFSPLAGEAVILREDRSLGMARTEVICANCHSHLGHVFEGEGYDTPTDQRYCVNSISLRLVPNEEK